MERLQWKAGCKTFGWHVKKHRHTHTPPPDESITGEHSRFTEYMVVLKMQWS